MKKGTIFIVYKIVFPCIEKLLIIQNDTAAELSKHQPMWTLSRLENISTSLQFFSKVTQLKDKWWREFGIACTLQQSSV